MNVWKILVDDVTLGGVVDDAGSLDAAAALNRWNNDPDNPNYQGDTAEPMRFVKV